MAAPVGSAFLAQVALEEAISFQPHVGIPIAVEARFVRAALVLLCQEVANSNGQGQHPGIVIMRIIGMALGIKYRGSKDGIRKVLPARPRLERRQVGAGTGVERLFDFRRAALHQAKISAGQFLPECEAGHPADRKWNQRDSFEHGLDSGISRQSIGVSRQNSHW